MRKYTALGPLSDVDVRVSKEWHGQVFVMPFSHMTFSEDDRHDVNMHSLWLHHMNPHNNIRLAIKVVQMTIQCFLCSQQENLGGNEPLNKLTLKPDEVLQLGINEYQN